ncbi:MAG: hypothetical protein ACLQBA_01705 [Candidatus Binataceae bacterium]
MKPITAAKPVFTGGVAGPVDCAPWAVGADADAAAAIGQNLFTARRAQFKRYSANSFLLPQVDHE